LSADSTCLAFAFSVSAAFLPGEVREPIPPGRYSSSRVWLDVRRYDRWNPSVRTSARVLAGGWVGGDPLPIQRRLSLGGPDLFPGYGFRSQSCAPAAFSEPARAPGLHPGRIAERLHRLMAALGCALVLGRRESLPAGDWALAPWPGAEKLDIYRRLEKPDSQ